MNEHIIEILLVEDNPGDVVLIKKSMEQSKLINLDHLHVARDGMEAMEFLRKEGAHLNAPRPDLILLDLNLPKKSGQEVLEEVKGDPNLRRIPVVVITSSSAEDDIIKSYNLHANCYIRKPVKPTEFVDIAKKIEGFWLALVILPPR